MKKNIRKMLCALTAVLLLTSFAGCGGTHTAASSSGKVPVSSKSSSASSKTSPSVSGASSASSKTSSKAAKTSSAAAKTSAAAKASAAPINFRPGVINASVSGHTLIALKADGGAIAVCGANDNLAADVAGWKDVAYAAAGYCYALGIDKSGSVLASLPSDAVMKEEWNRKYYTAVQNAKIASKWKNVTEISDFNGDIVAVTKDGKCLHAVNGEQYQKKVDAVLDSWTDLKHAYAFDGGAYGVKNDGTVVYVIGSNGHGFYDSYTPVQKWTNVERMALLLGYWVGIKSDGTVILPNTKFDLNNEGAMKRAGQLTNVADLFSNPSNKHSMDIVPLTKDGVFGEFSDVVAATRGDILIGIKRDGTIVHTAFDYTDGKVALSPQKTITAYEGLDSWTGLLVP
jgi:hypothetical protein